MKKNHSIAAMTLTVTLSLICTSIALGAPPKDPANAEAAFQRLKTLAGRWEGTTPHGKIALVYEVVSDGQALVEHEFMPSASGRPEEQMVTVYNLDRGHLVMTHYCHIGNQPHMQAQAFDSGSNAIRFDFTEGGNMTGDPGEVAMRRLVITFTSPDDLATEWTLYKGTQAQQPMALVYHRVK